MEASLKVELLEPFWVQLHHNIGYSKFYGRFVILEPLCYFEQNRRGLFNRCSPVDSLVYGRNIGARVASLIDNEHSDFLAQALVPYIQYEKYRYILLTDESTIFEKQRIPEFLRYLREHPELSRKVKGLIHYHIDEPTLSDADRETMTWYTREVKLTGSPDQIAFVLSERDPVDTLQTWELGISRFAKHLSSKLNEGKIDVVGEYFTGEPDVHDPVRIRFSQTQTS